MRFTRYRVMSSVYPVVKAGLGSSLTTRVLYVLSLHPQSSLIDLTGFLKSEYGYALPDGFLEIELYNLRKAGVVRRKQLGFVVDSSFLAQLADFAIDASELV
jgi:hypothetical protein